MINLNTNKQLNIILTNTNKALREVINSASPKELQKLSEGKDLKSLLQSILKQSSKNSSQDELLLNMLKNNPTFKELGNVTKNITSLLNTLKQDKNPLPLEKILQNFLTNIKDINEKNLQTNIKNSGIFLESKIKNLKNIDKEIFSQDLKSVLLKTHQELSNSSNQNRQEILKQLDKLSLQIDYYQLLSHLSNSSSLYIPYSWDSLEDGNITMKKIKNDKFFTDINLKLKDFEELRLRLGLFETNQLNINITTKSKELKRLIKENMPQLKRQLIDVGIMPTSIKFLDDNADLTSTYSSSESLDMGFEVKV